MLLVYVCYLTVTLIFLVILLPSVVVTLIVQLPFLSAFIFPLEVTLAIFLLVELYFNFFVVAFEGEIVAFMVDVFPFFNVILLLFKESFVIFTTFGPIVIFAEAVN